MKHFYTLTVLFILSSFGHSQSYNFDALTNGATGTFANGWVGTPTTGYSWRARADSTLSQGTGPRFDHTLGNASGIYLYVEASSPAAAGDTAVLTSPSISSIGFVNPGLSIWYHMAGTGMGNLYIDVYSGSSWTLNVDSLIGPQQTSPTSPWLNKIVNVGSFTTPVQVRFRAVYGASWSGDMAIDDISIVEMPAYDANFLELVPSHFYYMIPVEQIQPMSFTSEVKNDGADTLTGVTVSGTINTTPLSGSLAQLTPGQQSNIALTPSYTPAGSGLFIGNFTVSINEMDTINYNDSSEIKFEVSDTIMAREDGDVNLGIGFTGTGELGQVFEIFNTDSLSSVSFKLVNPDISPTGPETLKLKLYGWNTTTNLPGAIIDSTAIFTIPSSASTWYTIQFTCDRILDPGKYFIAVEQLTVTNVALGYTPDFYEENSVYYNIGTGWTDLASAGFSVALGIRANLGVVSFPSVSLGNDTGYCANGNVVVTAPSGWSSYLWSNGVTLSSSTVTAADSNFWVEVTDVRGCKVRDTIIVAEFPNPTVNLPASAGVCDNNFITLAANNDPTYTYIWNNGSTDSSITVNTSGFFAVTITNTLGCSSTGFVSVVAGLTPVAQIGMYPINFCTGLSTSVTAAGSGNIYQWSNGTTGKTTQISQAGPVYLTVTSPGGCVAYDTSLAVEVSNPLVILSDTALSYCDNSVGSLSVNTLSGASYLWSTGDTIPSISGNISGLYWVSTTVNGCTSSDSGMATVLVSPIVDLGKDTTICNTESYTLDAGSGSNFTWNTGATTQSIVVNTSGTYSVIVENAQGCTDADTVNVTVEVCAGIFNQNGNEIQIGLYPNPATQIININVDPRLINATIEIIDAKGAYVYNGQISNEIETIDVTSWAAGMYTLKVISENDFYSTKFVVKH